MGNRSNISFKALSLISLFLAGIFSASLSSAAVLGRFDHIRNLPGYLNLQDKKSPVYDIEKIIDIDSDRNNDGIERRTPSRLLRDVFMNSDGSVKVEAIEMYKNDLENYMFNTFLAYCSEKIKDVPVESCPNLYGDTRSERFEKWLDRKLPVAADFAYAEFNRAIALSPGINLLDTDQLNSSSGQLFLEALFQALETADGIRSSTEEDSSGMILLKGSFTALFGERKLTDGPDAANLVIPTPLNDDLFYSHPEELKAAGLDLSQLDPIDSGFWRKPQTPISQFDTTNYNNQLKEAFSEEEYEKIKDIEDPNTVINVEYLEVPSGGMTPKVDVDYKGYEVKLKLNTVMTDNIDSLNPITAITYFLRNSTEVRTEFVANNLAAALGYTVDPTYFKKSVRLFLPEDNFSPELAQSPQGMEEIHRRFQSARTKLFRDLRDEDTPIKTGQSSFERDLSIALSDIKQMESGPQKGRYYFHVKSSSLEFRRNIDMDWKFGSFIKYGFGKVLKREFRAFQLMYLWLSDPDDKDVNAAMGLIKVDPDKSGGAEKKVYFSATDMGYTFGSIFGKNKPNFFNYELIDTSKLNMTLPPEERDIKFKGGFRYNSPLYQAMNHNDAKWIVRMMAQLTEEQILRSFLKADYPLPVAELYTQKLLNRRDQLVQALDLGEETIIDNGVSRKIGWKTSKIENPKEYYAPSCPECFEGGILRSLPEGVYDENWTATFGLRDSNINSSGESTLGRIFKSSLARRIGRRIQRIGFGTGLEFQGVELGIDSFAPAKYLIENPLSDDDNKYLILDVMRFGINQSYNANYGDLGIFPNADRYQAGLGTTETWEFIKVRPVETSDVFVLSDILKNLKPSNMVGKPLSGLTREMLEDMSIGDTLISSRYLTFGASAIGSPSGILTPGFGAEGGLFTTAIDRVVAHRDKSNKAVLAWTDIANSGLKAGLFLDYIIGTQPLLAGRIEKLNQKSRVYSVDLDQPGGKSLVLRHLTKDIPSDELEPYRMRTSELKTTTKEIAISLFGLANWNWYTQSADYVLSDRDQEVLKSYYQYLRGRNSGNITPNALVSSKGTESVALVDRTDKTAIAKLDLNYTKAYAKRDDYIKMIEEFKGLIPPQMVMFDANSVNYYMGPLEVAGTVLISSKGLDQAFSPRPIFGQLTDDQICAHYAQYTKLLYPGFESQSEAERIRTFCDEVKGILFAGDYAERVASRWQDERKVREIVIGAKNFIKRYKRARSAYMNLKVATKEEDIKKEAESFTKRMTSLLQSKPRQGGAHMALLSMMTKDSIFREIEISSKLEAFPGQRASLLLNKQLQGDDALEDALSFHTNDNATIMNSTLDPVMAAISPYFYNYYWRNGINRTFPSK